MASYTAVVEWTLGEGEDFARGRYSRAHTLSFDGGVTVPASASPRVVPKPWSVDAAVDPEELLVAALSNCHMLTFLDLARRAGFVVAAYRDAAQGVMAKDERGRIALTQVTLRPDIRWQGPAPDAAALADLNHRAHEACFIANSVRTEIVIEPV